MNKHFIQVTNGLLPVMVLALLAVAFVAGQARANFPGAGGGANEALMTPAAKVVPFINLPGNAETLPQIIDAVAELPGNVNLHIRVLGELSLVERGTTFRKPARQTLSQ